MLKSCVAVSMKALLDMVYPRRCIGCGLCAPEAFGYICWDCWSDCARVEPPFCRWCGDPVAGAVEHDFVCYSCSASPPAFDAARSAARYSGVVGEALRQLKYEQALWLADDLAAIMYSSLQAEFPGRRFDLVMPVPLFRIRRRDRGFNQSLLLARALNRRLRSRLAPGLLRRIKPTATQTHLTAQERLSNVNNAFQYRRGKHAAGKNVLLVDDVMTTGATVNACAKALKKGGCASVYVLTAARG